MSYIRNGYPLVYVEGNSEDYIFGHVKGGIVDYGGISDTGFIELLFEYWEIDKSDGDFRIHVIKRLADRLGVKLRKKPLTDKQCDKLHEANMKKFEKDNPEFYNTNSRNPKKVEK